MICINMHVLLSYRILDCLSDQVWHMCISLPRLFLLQKRARQLGFWMRNGDDKQELLADLIIQYVRPYFLLLLQTMPSLSLSPSFSMDSRKNCEPSQPATLCLAQTDWRRRREALRISIQRIDVDDVLRINIVECTYLCLVPCTARLIKSAASDRTAGIDLNAWIYN